MENAAQSTPPPGIIRWVFFLGAAGFTAGFLGPLALNPGANQGPLLGILITGPGGALLGLLLFVVCFALRVPADWQWLALKTFSGTIAVLTLFFCLPQPVFRGFVEEIQVAACKPPVEMADQAVAYWQKRIAGVTWQPPRANWEQDSRARLAQDPAVILDVTVLRRLPIYESRKPWNRGAISTPGWVATSEQKSYYVGYAGESCASFGSGSKLLQYVSYSTPAYDGNAQNWPPREVSAFLNLLSLEPVPPAYEPLANR